MNCMNFVRVGEVKVPKGSETFFLTVFYSTNGYTARDPTAYPFYIPFFTKKVPFSYTFD